MGHTPGPWAVGGLSSNDGEAEVISNADGSKTICWTADTYSEDEDAGIVTAEDFANGRLIAAAPELLDAMRGSLAFLDWASEWRERDATAVDQEIAFEIGRITRAIAKAEGGGE